MKRFTIGFLDENAHNEYHSYLMNGVFEAAQKYDLNVIRFGYFPEHIIDKYDTEITMMVNLIQQYDLDGLLFLGWTRVASSANRKLFSHLIQSIPVVSVGRVIAGIPSIYFDADIFVREILLHLIQVHHLQRIAFIAPTNPDGRVKVYQDTLTEYGIYHPEILISETDIASLDLMQRGRKSVAILMDERKAAFEAIVSLYNDETLSIIHELQLRGFKVPQDVIVTSYEDGEIGKLSTPSFTTIYYPWKELGFYSCQKMYELLTQGYTPPATMVPGKIIIRDSCGCLPDSIHIAKAGIKAFIKPLIEITDAEFQQLGQEFQNALNYPAHDGISLCRAFLLDCQAQTNSCFLTELERQLTTIPNYQRFQDYEDLVSILRKLLLPYCIKPRETLLWAENLFQQAQVLLQEKMTTVWAHEELESMIIKLTLQEMGQILITHFNLVNIMDSLSAYMAKLNLPSCYIYLFRNADRQTDLFLDYILAFEYRGGVRVQSAVNPTGTIRRKLKETMFLEPRVYTMNSQLLYIADLFIGFAVFEAGPSDERVYQTLSLNISMAIYGAMLLNKLDNSYQKLIEKSHQEGMAEIANSILHNISNILNNLNGSIQLINELVDNSSIEDFRRTNHLLENHLHDLASFIDHDPNGKKLMQQYLSLEDPLRNLQLQLLDNINRLNDKVNRINDIVTAQQSYTEIQFREEVLDVTTIVEDALRINLASLEENHIQIIKNYHEIPSLRGQRTKLFHILINLIKNAKEAMLEVPENQRRLIITIEQISGRKYIRITDTGCGIPADKLESIFAYGYTTKKDRNGFSLHNSGNYMAEMRGKILAESGGPGKGATFVLEFS